MRPKGLNVSDQIGITTPCSATYFSGKRYMGFNEGSYQRVY